MTTQPPPPRYRVVEQGRRLVVIDTQTGQPAVRPTAAVDAPPVTRSVLPTGPDRTDFSGRATLVTHPLYDDRAPRTLTLDPGAAQLIDGVRVCLIGGAAMLTVAALFQPLLFALPLVLLNPKVRAGVRAPVTAWLDRYDDTVSSAG